MLLRHFKQINSARTINLVVLQLERDVIPQGVLVRAILVLFKAVSYILDQMDIAKGQMRQ